MILKSKILRCELKNGRRVFTLDGVKTTIDLLTSQKNTKYFPMFVMGRYFGKTFIVKRSLPVPKRLVEKLS